MNDSNRSTRTKIHKVMTHINQNTGIGDHADPTDYQLVAAKDFISNSLEKHGSHFTQVYNGLTTTRGSAPCKGDTGTDSDERNA